MRIVIRLFFLFLVVALSGMLLSNFQGDEPLVVKQRLSVECDSLRSAVVRLSGAVKEKKGDGQKEKALLEECRLRYKRIEAFIKYFLPGDARKLNRAAVMQTVEDDEVTQYVPFSGFQYVESLMYDDSAEFKRKEIRNAVDEIFMVVDKLPESFRNLDIQENHLWEAMQYELVRQFMLGFTDFETPDSKAGPAESAAVLQGMKDIVLACYAHSEGEQRTQLNELYRLLDRSVAYMRNAHAPVNYFEYYTQYYNELSGQLGHTRDVVVTENNMYGQTALNLQIRSVFDPHAFNSYFFVPGKNFAQPAAVADLGRTLFFDPALSANNLRACASCHQAGKALLAKLAA
ncbi:MAG: cytochrome c peroxidase [Bacteroidia bacterium]